MAIANQLLVERLFLAQKDALWRYFVRRVRRRSDAEELAQEVYLRLLRVADADALRNPEAYLYAIAANLLKEHAMQQSICRNCVALEDAGYPEMLSEVVPYPDLVDKAERTKRLREVLAQLPAKCQAAVVMRHWNGLSYEEIAQQLGISVNMVKKYLVQALAHCRRRMGSLR
jgi:RNA polymerase sigma-70 factor (ECF subfamily)